MSVSATTAATAATPAATTGSTTTPAATTPAATTTGAAPAKSFATRLADARKELKDGEKLTRVAGHQYGRIAGGERDRLFVNLSGNARNGDAFSLVSRGGHEFHVYGSGKDKVVVEVGRAAATGTKGTATGTKGTGSDTTATTPTTAGATSGAATTAATGSSGATAKSADATSDDATSAG